MADLEIISVRVIDSNNKRNLADEKKREEIKSHVEIFVKKLKDSLAVNERSRVASRKYAQTKIRG